MARTDNPHLSAIVNAVTFGFYTAVVKQIAGLDLMVTISVTVITNIIGVYITYWIAGKVRKDNLWKVELFSPVEFDEYFTEDLVNADLQFTEFNGKLINVYCYSQAESARLKTLIRNRGEYKIKYNITEITKRF
jgi:hypothetical protein